MEERYKLLIATDGERNQEMAVKIDGKEIADIKELRSLPFADKVRLSAMAMAAMIAIIPQYICLLTLMNDVIKSVKAAEEATVVEMKAHNSQPTTNNQ